MKGVNKVIIVGTLGRDPEVKYLASGDAVCNLSVATSESWKNKAGEKVEKTEWHKIILFKRLAEIAGEYLSKGSSVYIEGKLQTRKWQDKNGIDHYSTEVVAGELQMLSGSGSKPKENNRPQSNSGSHTAPAQDDFDDQDIPF